MTLLRNLPFSRGTPPWMAALLVLLAGISLSGQAAQKLYVQTRYDEDAGVDAERHSACALETTLSRAVDEQAPKSIEVVVAAPPDEDARLLALSILHVDGRSGGMWTGKKGISLNGKLIDHGRVIASFNGRRSSIGGPLAPFRGTCTILQRCAQALGKDVAHWLEQPTRDAWLGEMSNN